jgi:hypothetical protein
VRNYVRNGRLKGVRIGKQYRIAREDVEALTGRRTALSSSDVEAPRHRVEVASVVQVDAIAPDAANRITNALMASAQGRSEADGPLRIDTIYDRERSHLKVILIGSVPATASLLKFINLLLQA